MKPTIIVSIVSLVIIGVMLKTHKPNQPVVSHEVNQLTVLPTEKIDQSVAAPISTRPPAVHLKSNEELVTKLSEDKEIQQITNLAQIVLDTPAKHEALTVLLGDRELLAKIASALHEPASIDGPAYTRKLRFLDALYEGMKFSEVQVSDQYLQLASDLINEEPPLEYRELPEQRQRFKADRVEIALVMMKQFPEHAQRLIGATSESGKQAIFQAKRIYKTYDLGL